MDETTTDQVAEKAAEDRRQSALWYAWGREDAGDRRLRDASASRVLTFDFAEFAADEVREHAANRDPAVASVQDQYRRYVAGLTAGTRLVNEYTGDVIEVIGYDGEAHLTSARIIDGPHGVPSVPKAFTFVSEPAHFADRRYRRIRHGESGPSGAGPEGQGR